MSTPSDTRDIPLRDVVFAPTDAPLRDDVNQLGSLVGQVLAEQKGEDFLALIERIRSAAILRREHDHDTGELHATLARIDPATAEAVVRAFATYFNAVNLAERVHRIRRRRDYQRSGSQAQPGGLLDVLQALKADGVDYATVCALIEELCVELVFTAHPTEAVRRALLEKEQDVVRGLIKDMDRDLTPQERRADLARMRMSITAAWQTAESPPVRPSVGDELEHVGFYLSDVLYRVLPVFYEAFAEAMQQVYGAVPDFPCVLRFGSWVGGDMDGNPNVGADTIRDSLAAQRRIILGAYQADLSRLAGLLSQSPERVGIDAAVLARIEDYRERFPEAAAALRSRNTDMPYRGLLKLIAARLDATGEGSAQAYAGPEEFVADLELIATSLRNNRGEHAGDFALQRTLWRARSFGFHLAMLDIRQDAGVHNQALAQCLDDADFSERSVEERVRRLGAVLDGGALPAQQSAALGEPAQATLAVFRTLARMRREYGAAALGPYIVSMSRSAADALAVLALARLAGTGAADEDQAAAAQAVAALDVAPLFETVADLEAAPQVLRALLSEPRYRAHVAQRGERQMVMLGYSDSSKDAGVLASRFALQQAQIALLAVGREFGVKIAFFHGRGGSISRGGGKTERGIIAAPRGSIAGYLRVTEQGEVIHRKYGLRALALRNLEQTTGAVLRASLRPRPAEPREPLWRERTREMAAVSTAAYRALVHEDAEFSAYFRQATPIDLIERLRLGSRPAKRAGAGDISALRAIPWVFAWSQTRGNLTAWYGVGIGLEHGIRTWGLEQMAAMLSGWAFFQALIDDMEMVLAKSDLDIFEGYSRLAGPLHAQFFPRIQAEFERTRSAVLAVRGADELLAGDLRLRQSIRLRNPYVDPINLLQQDLLQRWRAAGCPDDADYRALVATVNGISAGVQNTG